MASSNQHHSVGGHSTRTTAGSGAASAPELPGAQRRRRERASVRSSGPDSAAGRPDLVAKTKPSATAFDTATCTECDSRSFSRSGSGEWYCEGCGVVHTGTEIEFSEPGWKPREQRRTGPAASVSRISVGTTVGRVGDASAPSWAKYNDRLSHDQETLRHGLRELRAVAAALEVATGVTEQAAHRFRRVAEEGLLVGHSIEAMAAVCLHVTARKDERPFPLKQLAEASPVDCSAIKSAFSKLVRETDVQVAPPLPTAFIPRFASEAGLSTPVERRAREIAQALVDDGSHVGQSPTGVAAAALYGAATELSEPVTQDELASVAFVSVVTVSRQWQTIRDRFDIQT